jgi:hypothetical protein
MIADPFNQANRNTIRYSAITLQQIENQTDLNDASERPHKDKRAHLACDALSIVLQHWLDVSKPQTCGLLCETWSQSTKSTSSRVGRSSLLISLCQYVWKQLR